MKIALLGANGRIGQRIAQETLARGHEVKALVRHPERFPMTHPHLTVAPVNIFDAASIAEALPDADETAAAERFLAVQRKVYADAKDNEQRAWTDLCQMVLASNAFLYVD